MKIQKHILLLLLILAIGLFFRLFEVEKHFMFGHEQDLQAWIVKDIIIEKHPRLIGQETSIIGVFISPLYYYILVPFFLLFNMDPIGSVVPVTLIALATIVSVYFVFTRLFSKNVGLIGSYIYAISYSISFNDRWPVPTQPTFLWTIWFLFVTFSLAKRNYEVIPILIILIALISHIHIAFLPLLVLVPISLMNKDKEIFTSINRINVKRLLFSLGISLVLVLPFFLFEIRHEFQQIKGFSASLSEHRDGPGGLYKASLIVEEIDSAIYKPIYYKFDSSFLKIGIIPISFIIVILSIIILHKIKFLNRHQLLLIYSWIFIVFIGHIFSKRAIEDYYFNNLNMISILIFSLLIYWISKSKKYYLASFIVIFVLSLINFKALITRTTPSGEYVDKKNALMFISDHAKRNNYSCVSYNFISDVGAKYGYRYLSWYEKLALVSPSNDVPVYNLVIPPDRSNETPDKIFGNIGILLPVIESAAINEQICTDQGRQLLPLNGFNSK